MREAREQGGPERAVALGEESRVVAWDLGDGSVIGVALLGLAVAAHGQGNLERAVEALAESLALCWASGMKLIVGYCLAWLA